MVEVPGFLPIEVFLTCLRRRLENVLNCFAIISPKKRGEPKLSQLD